MKIGVLGGSFDPPHKGHIKIAREAEKALSLDLVLFVPCRSHTLKGHAPSASPFHRSAMTALAVSGKGNWLVEPVELERGGVSYTVETLRFLHEKYGNAELYFIMGADSREGFPMWKNPGEIRKLAKLVIFPRAGYSTEVEWTEEILMKMKKIDISSKEIRERIASGKGSSRDLTRAVGEYIRKHSLYVADKEV